MASPRISKPSRSSSGFTLIEIVLVLAIVALLAVASTVQSFPALSRFACVQESQTLLTALKRARHIAQVSRINNVAFEITEDRYLISFLGEDGGKILLDEFSHEVSTPISLSNKIVFATGAGYLSGGVEHIEIIIGVVGFPCSKLITINEAGGIFSW